MSSPKTLASNTPNVTLTGVINAYGAVGTYNGYTWDAAVIGSAATHFTVHNTGTILSQGTSNYDSGLVLGASGTVFNTGTIKGGDGIGLFGATGTSSISNTGKIFGTLNFGVYSADFTNLTNSKYLYGARGGVILHAGGLVDNAANATIAGGGYAIIAGAAATITNAGTLRGGVHGISLDDGGTVVNTGLILQTDTNLSVGAIESYLGGTVTNAGLIEAGIGVILFGNKTVTGFITNSGTIEAVSTYDINSNAATGFLDFGVGIEVLETGEVEEVVNSKTIEGNHAGIVFAAYAGTVINHSIISSSDGYGVDFYFGGGTVSNTGTIYGAQKGVVMGDGTVTNFITNSGHIEAQKAPVSLAGGTYFSGAVVANGAATIINSGTISDPNGDGIQLTGSVTGVPQPATIINSGLIQGLYAVLFDAPGGVKNTGTILGKPDGVFLLPAGGQIYNSGLIEATGATFNYTTLAHTTFTAAGVRLATGGTVTNASAGTILATGGNAIHGYAGPGVADPTYVFNNGLIDAAEIGIFFSAGGSVQNAGRITAGTTGIYNSGTAGALSVYNAKSGFISGAHAGVNGQAGRGTLVNKGTIIATGTTFTNNGTVEYSRGVGFKYGANVTNASTGTIIGALGIALGGTTASYVYNAGHVTATSRTGIYLKFAGTVINAKTGFIESARPGIDLYGGGYAINAGTIDAGRTGIYLKDGGTAVNTGTITAATAGIYGLSGLATVTNAGTITGADGILLAGGGTVIDTGVITGATYAISFAAGDANRLVINAAADITGSVQGGNAILELAADGAAIGMFSRAMQTQFANFGSIEIDSGAIWDFAGNFKFNSPNALLNDGTIKESSADKLTISSALTGTGVVELSKKTLALDGSVASGQEISFTGTHEILDLGDPAKFGGQIENFKLHDTIDLTGVKLSAITATQFVGSVLTLDEGSTKLLFTFANPGAFGNDTFALTAAGHGTDMTLAAAAGALPPVTQVTTLAPLATFGS